MSAALIGFLLAPCLKAYDLEFRNLIAAWRGEEVLIRPMDQRQRILYETEDYILSPQWLSRSPGIVFPLGDFAPLISRRKTEDESGESSHKEYELTLLHLNDGSTRLLTRSRCVPYATAVSDGR